MPPLQTTAAPHSDTPRPHFLPEPSSAANLPTATLPLPGAEELEEAVGDPGLEVTNGRQVGDPA